MWLVRLLLSVFAVLTLSGPKAGVGSAQAAPSESSRPDACLIVEGSQPANVAVKAADGGAPAVTAVAAPETPVPTALFSHLCARLTGNDAKARLPKKAHGFVYSGSSPPVV